MNILKTVVIAALLGTMTLEEVQAVALNKHHHHKRHAKKHIKHHQSLAQGEDADEEAPASEPPKPVVADDKETKAKIEELKEKLDSAEGKTIEPVSEEQEAANTKDLVNDLAAQADRAKAKKALDEAELKKATLVKGRGEIEKQADKEVNEAKLKKEEVKIEALKKEVRDGKEAVQAEANKNKEKEAEIKDLKKSITALESKKAAGEADLQTVQKVVNEKIAEPKPKPSKDADESAAVKKVADNVAADDAKAEEKKEEVEKVVAANPNPAIASVEKAGQDFDDEKASAAAETEDKEEQASKVEAGNKAKKSKPDAAANKDCAGSGLTESECHTSNLPEHHLTLQQKAEGIRHHNHKRAHKKHHHPKGKIEKEVKGPKSVEKPKVTKCSSENGKEISDKNSSPIDLSRNRKNPKPTGPAASDPCVFAKEQMQKAKAGPSNEDSKPRFMPADKEDEEDDQDRDFDVVKGLSKKNPPKDAVAEATAREEKAKKAGLKAPANCDKTLSKPPNHGPDDSADVKNI